MADKLSPQEAAELLRLLSCLDAYVNRTAQVLPIESSPEQLLRRAPKELSRIRQLLWSNPQLLDDFVRTNPFSLSPEQLAEVEQFREKVRGQFYVERCLKAGGLLINTGSEQTIYLVCGITDSVAELLERASPGGVFRLVETTLLPFRGRIVWDGILQLTPVTFGGNTRRSFADLYRRAKAQGRIVVALGSEARTQPKPPRKQTDWRPAVQALLAGAEALGQPETPLQRAAFRLLKHAAAAAAASLAEPLDPAPLVNSLNKASRALNQLVGEFNQLD